jgi:hypothetical protein
MEHEYRPLGELPDSTASAANPGRFKYLVAAIWPSSWFWFCALGWSLERCPSPARWTRRR